MRKYKEGVGGFNFEWQHIPGELQGNKHAFSITENACNQKKKHASKVMKSSSTNRS